jgi:methyl-accepting chemotaxis protein
VKLRWPRLPLRRPKARLASRMLAAFAIVLASVGAVGFLSISEARSVDAATGEISEQSLGHLADVGHASALADHDFQRALEFVVQTQQIGRDGLWQSMQLTDSRIETFIEDFRANGGGDRIATLERAYSDYVEVRDSQLVKPVMDGDFGAAEGVALGPLRQAYSSVEGAFYNLREAEEREAMALKQRALDRSETARTRVLAGLGAAALLGIAIAFLLARRISKAMRSVTSAAEGLASGDLSRRAEVRTKDEIATMAAAFNQMAEELQGMVEHDRDVKEALERAVAEYSTFAAQVARGDLTARVATNGSVELTTLTDGLNGMVTGLGDLSSQVSSSAQALSQSATEILATVSEQSATVTQQSTAINETSVTVDELRTSAEQAAIRAQEVAVQAQTSVQVSSEGTAAVQDIVSRMEEIRVRVETIAQNILTLSEQTQQISDLTQMVDDIAEQSNLLALNATIEAARAGEQGRGFAVVASEVRNLAEQSKQGTAQVRSILTDIQKATNAAVMATEQGIKVVEEGRSHTSRAGGAISDLATTIRETAQAAQQISASAQQQSLAIDQISESMADINQATSQFVSGVEESKSAARSLADLADELRSLTDAYRVSAEAEQ